MNYMKQIAEMLGVEIGEEFKARLTENPIIVNSEIFVIREHALETDDGVQRDDILRDLLMGTYEIIKLPWKPKNSERVWYRDADNSTRAIEFNDLKAKDLILYKLGKLYRTLDGAIAHAEEDDAYWDEIRKEIEE